MMLTAHMDGEEAEGRALYLNTLAGPDSCGLLSGGFHAAGCLPARGMHVWGPRASSSMGACCCLHMPNMCVLLATMGLHAPVETCPYGLASCRQHARVSSSDSACCICWLSTVPCTWPGPFECDTLCP